MYAKWWINQIEILENSRSRSFAFYNLRYGACIEMIVRFQNIDALQQNFASEKYNLPDLSSTLFRNQTICAAGLASATIHVNVKSWFSRTSTLAFGL